MGQQARGIARGVLDRCQQDPALGQTRGVLLRGIWVPDEGDEGKYVVQIGRYRGEIEVEEAGFFVREFDAEAGRVRLSDGATEPLDAMDPTQPDAPMLGVPEDEEQDGGERRADA